MALPFGKPALSLFSGLARELRPVMKEKKAKKILWLGGFNLVCVLILMAWCKSTNSVALLAFTYLTLFDILSLSTCLLGSWVEQQRPDSAFTFGYERFEVLAVFAATILGQLSSLFIIKESIERLIKQPEIHLGRFTWGLTLAFVCHLVVTYGMNSRALNHVIAASSSSWLQEHVAEMSQSLCHIVPGLSAVLLPRLNPFVLLGCAGAVVLGIAHFLMDVYSYHLSDPIIAIMFALMVIVTMLPMSIYTGRLLLQTAPTHVISQLDKCLREASTLDGVLEFRNEFFWTLAFDNLAGSVHVRIRRDANEQLVLAHLVDRLSNLVLDLSIQVFKDEWAWSKNTLQVLNESALRFPPTSAAPGIAPDIKVNGTKSLNLTASNSLSSPLFLHPSNYQQRTPKDSQEGTQTTSQEDGPSSARRPWTGQSLPPIASGGRSPGNVSLWNPTTVASTVTFSSLGASSPTQTR